MPPDPNKPPVRYATSPAAMRFNARANFRLLAKEEADELVRLAAAFDRAEAELTGSNPTIR
jgi:hypothetical protein